MTEPTEPEARGVTSTLAGDIAALIIREMPCISRWRDTFAGVEIGCDVSDPTLILISITPWDLDSVAEGDRDPVKVTARVEIRALERQERQTVAICAGKHGG